MTARPSDHVAVLHELRERGFDIDLDNREYEALEAAIAALSTPPEPEAVGDWPKHWPKHWPALETAVDTYVTDYEWCGEDDEGRDGFYTPAEHERAMILDAIFGLFGDDDFKAAWIAALAPTEKQP